MHSLDRLFVHELQDMLAAERELATALEKLGMCNTGQQLQQVLSPHLDETHSHIQRLQSVLTSLGVQPTSEECEGMAGITEEHDRTMRETPPDPGVHDAFDIGIALRAEQYEIAGYQHLQELARSLGYQQAASELAAILEEEQTQYARLTETLSSLVGSQQRMQQTQSQPPQQMTGGGSQFAQAGGQGQTGQPIAQSQQGSRVGQSQQMQQPQGMSQSRQTGQQQGAQRGRGQFGMSR